MGMCGSPNTAGMNAAAEDQARLAREAYTWFQGEAGRTQGMRDDLARSALATQEQQRQLADTSLQWATEDRKFLDETARPLARQLAEDAAGYDTAARREQESSAARADVQMALDGQQAQQRRSLARAGVGLSSGKSLALSEDAALTGALGRAAAGTQAVRNVEATGVQRRTQAAGLAGAVGGNPAAGQALALQAGNAANQSGATALNAATSGTGLMNQAFTLGMQGNQSSSNMLGRVASMDAAQSSSDASTLGTVASIVGMFMSSKDTKEQNGTTPGKDSLKAIRTLKADRSWQYKPGQGDGGEHNGPYAEEVQLRLGDSAAPGGKMIRPAGIEDHAIPALRSIGQKLKSVDAALSRLEAA